MAEKIVARVHCVVCDNLTAARGRRIERLAATDVTCEHCRTAFVAHDSQVVNSAPGAAYTGGAWVR